VISVLAYLMLCNALDCVNAGWAWEGQASPATSLLSRSVATAASHLFLVAAYERVCSAVGDNLPSMKHVEIPRKTGSI
jgi:hypothetical protein